MYSRICDWSFSLEPIKASNGHLTSIHAYISSQYTIEISGTDHGQICVEWATSALSLSVFVYVSSHMLVPMCVSSIAFRTAISVTSFKYICVGIGGLSVTFCLHPFLQVLICKMPVNIEITYALSMGDGVLWKVKADHLETVNGNTFVKLRPHEEAFARFCVHGFLDMPKRCRPALGQCPGWKALLQLRNSAMEDILIAAGDDASLSLFGSQEQRGKKKRQRVNAARLQEIRENPEIVEVFIPGIGDNPGMNISMVRPAHPCDDPIVRLDGDTIEHIVFYIRAKGIDIESLTSRRGYGGLQPGVWKNGNGSVVRAVTHDSDSDKSGDEAAPVKRKLKRLKPDTSGEAEGSLCDSGHLEPVPAPISDV